MFRFFDFLVGNDLNQASYNNLYSIILFKLPNLLINFNWAMLIWSWYKGFSESQASQHFVVFLVGNDLWCTQASYKF